MTYCHIGQQGSLLYLLILPWGIIGQLAWWAIPLTIVQAYLFAAIDEIARAGRAATLACGDAQ